MDTTQFALIVDPHYGDQLLSLARELPVWIVDTSLNRRVAEQVWAERERSPDFHEVTTFDSAYIGPTTRHWLAILDMIEPHYDPLGDGSTMTDSSSIIARPLNEVLERAGE